VSEEEQTTSDNELSQKLIINYVKSNLHRIVRVDGAFGAVKDDEETILLELFSDRRSVPKRVILSFGEDGDVQNVLAEPPSEPTQIDRELEVSLSMSMDTALSLVQQLVELLDTEEDDDEKSDEDEN
jgi:hypothetical protein